jgi:hypothetical protein
MKSVAGIALSDNDIVDCAALDMASTLLSGVEPLCNVAKCTSRETTSLMAALAIGSRGCLVEDDD